jgi:hypothetical protein
LFATLLPYSLQIVRIDGMMHYDYKRLRVDTAIHGDSSTAPGRHAIRACLGIGEACLRRNQGPSAASKKIMMERIDAIVPAAESGADSAKY